MPVAELIDLDALRVDGRPPTPARVRAALPRGWVLDEDGVTARRDLRMLFREGWILVVGLVVFGGIGLALFWSTFPAGWRGLARLGLLVLAVLVAGGVAAPAITRALNRR